MNDYANAIHASHNIQINGSYHYNKSRNELRKRTISRKSAACPLKYDLKI